jgi:hypothetical protein
MEVTRIRGCAVIYVILLCALAQGGSEGKKEDDLYKDDHQLLSSFLHIHGKQVCIYSIYKYGSEFDHVIIFLCSVF